jgi:hypothetical protein
MKKILCLVLLLLVGLIPVSAAPAITAGGITEIEGAEVISYRARGISYNGRPASGTALGALENGGDYGEYRLFAEKAGRYNVTLSMAATSSAEDIADIYINGELREDAKLSYASTGSWTVFWDTPYFHLDLPKGEFILKIVAKAPRLGDIGKIKFLGCDEALLNARENFSSEYNDGRDGWLYQYYDTETNEYIPLSETENGGWVLPALTETGVNEIIVGVEFFGSNVGAVSTPPKKYAVKTYTAKGYAEITIGHDGDISGNSRAAGYGWRNIKIMKNNEKLWPSGDNEWQLVKGSEAKVSYSLKTTLKPGDRIHFISASASHLTGNMSHYTRDSSVRWIPTLIVVGKTAEEIENSVTSAEKNVAPLKVNNGSVQLTSYNIGGSNYYKLRDIARVLSGSASRFDVLWDELTNSIHIIKGMPYTPAPEPGEGEGAPLKVQIRAFVNGVPVDMDAYEIGGFNYIKLRDIAAAVGFSVDWDGETVYIIHNA